MTQGQGGSYMQLALGPGEPGYVECSGQYYDSFGEKVSALFGMSEPINGASLDYVKSLNKKNKLSLFFKQTETCHGSPGYVPVEGHVFLDGAPAGKDYKVSAYMPPGIGSLDGAKICTAADINGSAARCFISTDDSGVAHFLFPAGHMLAGWTKYYEMLDEPVDAPWFSEEPKEYTQLSHYFSTAIDVSCAPCPPGCKAKHNLLTETPPELAPPDGFAFAPSGFTEDAKDEPRRRQRQRNLLFASTGCPVGCDTA